MVDRVADLRDQLGEVAVESAVGAGFDHQAQERLGVRRPDVEPPVGVLRR